ncbi:MAG: hypothetical protein LBI42_11320 [Chitinispirillales bacterium]|jgi:hypothetical protein|nr:hypothetical protein [Chitinispirillales bacterium]
MRFTDESQIKEFFTKDTESTYRVLSDECKSMNEHPKIPTEDYLKSVEELAESYANVIGVPYVA